MERGDLAQAVIHGEEASAISAALGTTGSCHKYSSMRVLHVQGRRPERAAPCEEGFTLCRKLGNTWGLAVGLSDMGAEAEDRGEGQAALEYYRESLSVLIDDPMTLLVILGGMASEPWRRTDGSVRTLLGIVAFSMRPGNGRLEP